MDSKQNFAKEVEDAINGQINNELSASYNYLSMSNYCSRTEIALPGAAAYFGAQSIEEREHAQKLIDYQHKRGGKVDLQPIDRPTRQTWSSLLEMFQTALELERNNNQALLELHSLARHKNTPDFTNFLEEFYLRVQVEEIREMAAKCAQLERIGDSGIGVHLFDRELAKEAKQD
ncbi:Ferritin [Aphelenchoides fujianensis]|nr:Ferritin [Aphelenchoides fujianensis]